MKIEVNINPKEKESKLSKIIKWAKGLTPNQIDTIFIMLIAALFCGFFLFWWIVSTLGIIL